MSFSKKDFFPVLEYSIHNNIELKILGKSGKIGKIVASKYDSEKIYGKFLSGDKATYYIKNIETIDFVSNDEKKKYDLGCLCQLLEIKEDMIILKINQFKEYCQFVINHQSIEKKYSDENSTNEEINFSEIKLKKYKKMFENISSGNDKLLLKYLFIRNSKSGYSKDNKPILLLTKSNYSQKVAIENALNNQVSVIEGPPGTGKTTTIMSIIANLIIRGKKVVVVSKNNSAVNNIIQEFDFMNLPKFYLRLGKSKIMDELAKEICVLTTEYKKYLENIEFQESVIESQSLLNEYTRLKEIEEKVNNVMQAKNQLEELHNQNRHLEKRNNAYDINVSIKLKKYLRKISNDKSQKIIDFVATRSLIIENQKRLSLLTIFIVRILFSMNLKTFKENSITLQLILEDIYLKNLINQQQEYIKNSNLEELQDELSKSYTENYNKKSKINLINALKVQSETKLFNEALKKVAGITNRNDLKKNISAIQDIYPVILTTVDAAVFNFSDCLSGETNNIDYIIMDEASQCDIISGLPILSIAKNIIVVGDQKQLSAITDKSVANDAPQIEDCYNYYEKTFLDSIKEVFNPATTLLQEHYRCDYNIINYCNKFFYDNELIIYTNNTKSSMQLVEVSDGIYLNDKSNDREVTVAIDLMNNNIKNNFVITPFANQGKLLKARIENGTESCGTIHTFQGRGENDVYFSTVLNNSDFANNHLHSNHNLFTKELINVAVSRAKKKFVLITDKQYMIKNSTEIRGLVEYIEAYGEIIPDKTVCIFDNLYSKMKFYKPKDNCDNIFEQTLLENLQNYLKINPRFNLIIKAKLADLITDKKYLDSNPNIKKFVLQNGTHVDFLVYSKELSKPILVIELDGKYHDWEEQKQRDLKKDAAIGHMNIALWRISSKSALTKNDLIEKLNGFLLPQE